MQCPKCSAKDIRVIDSRVQKNGLAVRRRRLCQNCDYRFSTNEEIVREGVMVVKKDDRREEFDRSKLLNGINRACDKRPINSEQIELLVSDVMAELESEFENEIPSHSIGERIMTRLKAIDHVAYVRFACVYKRFEDIDAFTKEISALKASEGAAL